MAPLSSGVALKSDDASQSTLGREFDFTDDDFRFLAKCAYEHAGIALSDNKVNLVYGRLSRRLRALKLPDFKTYRDYLTKNDREIENFINSISTNHTKFFRESHHFDHLHANVSAPFGRERMAGRRMRIWSAGCSSGEEPYTIASVLARDIPDLKRHDVLILATDIDTEILSRAARGEYQPAAVDEIPAAYKPFFSVETRAGREAMVVADDLRDIVRFKQLNLMQDWPIKGLFDAIFCRNVMIYFDAPTKARLIDRFIAQLKPDGWLYIGHSESLTGGHPGLKLMGRTIYRKIG
ncbi:CheR family methyltransferase [Pseudolabrys sp.]|uniref:CheR family methyltransferase n=1 Tax=Pseudolabrys sp. TaxID=1960880 RepID=UPI003D0B6BB1